MARKRRQIAEQHDEAQHDAATRIRYVGEVAQVAVCGVSLVRNEWTEVTEAVAARFEQHPSFEVSRGDVHEG